MRLLYLLAGLLAFWSIFLTVIFRLEKRMVWPYGTPNATPAYDDPSGYGSHWVNEAVQCGFTLFGWAPDVKGPMYKVNYAMLVSAERDVFAVIGVGAMLNMRLAATWLHTPTSDGRSFYSTDKQTGVQIDLTRNWTNQLVPANSFAQLLQSHREWVRENGVMPRAFTKGREVEEFRAMREAHYRAMERAGLIGYTDGTASYFKFTLSGAARTAIWSYFLGMARQLSMGRFPRNA